MGRLPSRRDDEGVAAWAALLRAQAAAVRAIERDVQAGAGLPLSWYDVLLELNVAPGRQLRMHDLGEAVVLSRTRVSRLVDELEAAGLVRREPNLDDRRSALAAITDEGRARLRQAAPVYLAAIRRRFVDVLQPGEVPVLRDALERVAARNHP